MQQWLNMQMYLKASVLCRLWLNKLPLHSILLEQGCQDTVEGCDRAGFSFLLERQNITWDPIFQGTGKVFFYLVGKKTRLDCSPRKIGLDNAFGL